jgi:hypothetical protein
MIEVDIDREDGRGRHQWWFNFRDYSDSLGYDFNDVEDITKALAEWNVIDKDPDSTKIYFENEHDQLLFMLRFA